jgi:pyruvate/2-oxoacid:ferredoxin oxidoreductase alpha subunit
MGHNSTKQSIGVVTVYMARPWSAIQFLSVLPKSVQKIHVLDLTSGDSVVAPPALFLDVAGSFHSNSESWVNSSLPELVSMRYTGTFSILFICNLYTNR